MTAVSRVKQGVRALLSWARPVDDELAARLLPPKLLPLYLKMRRTERQHSLNVLRTLQRRGFEQPELLAAALLHDVGKTRAPYPLWARVLVVLAGRFLRKRTALWGSGSIDSWKRPFVIRDQHPAWSAEMVSAAGGAPLLVSLVAAHADKLGHPPQNEFERLLIALQEADNAN